MKSKLTLAFIFLMASGFCKAEYPAILDPRNADLVNKEQCLKNAGGLHDFELVRSGVFSIYPDGRYPYAMAIYLRKSGPSSVYYVANIGRGATDDKGSLIRNSAGHPIQTLELTSGIPDRPNFGLSGFESPFYRLDFSLIRFRAGTSDYRITKEFTFDIRRDEAFMRGRAIPVSELDKNQNLSVMQENTRLLGSVLKYCVTQDNFEDEAPVQQPRARRRQ